MKKRRASFAVILLFLSVLVMSITVLADEQPESKNKSVIFLFDSSGSMKTNDENRLAIDSIAQLTYALPSDYRVGVVSYNANVVISQQPVDSNKRSRIMDLANRIQYEGFSNAGKGMLRAVDLLKKEKAGEKTIVLLTDGEILMKDDEATRESSSLYRKAVKKASEAGITIHVIGLGSQMRNMKNPIFAAAEKTGGGSYLASRPKDIQNAIDTILIDKLNIKQTNLAIVDADGKQESLSLDCPFVNAGMVRVLLTSNAPIKNLKTNFQAEAANQINGEKYSLIQIKKPTSEKIDLSFQGASGSRVKIAMIPEYRILPKVKVEYDDKVPSDPEAVYYERTARITYTFYDMENQNLQLWTEPFFDHNRVDLSSDGKNFQEKALSGGKITIQEAVTKDQTENISFGYSKLPFYVYGENAVKVQLEGPPALPVEKPKPPYLLIGAGIAVAVLIIALIIWLLLRRKPEPLPPDDKPEPSRYSYTGKLNIYITRAPAGYDIPPLTYNLFRLPSGKVMSLADILESCAVQEFFEGADKIYFKSGPNHNLILTNNSDCTVMKNREILMKKKSYQITVGGKVDIVFEDETSELTFQYKDLKPSEMR
ncbi:Ca-activated chloride channel family protein [Anaerocolumna jejuensis DSM 15929]|uniref:Ca-activated chloride channel family protein n=1 Tax=Anaerocolumna jejuensis DSM 15929 TaxID=1121322 RepID=A0A1M6XDE5_9FIRM|nr:vWA domain-containing protein [Anaerocolumna jejuensis]SHL03951.1 Ca-activated chloride channel family protein [Anaerocolumna jejuensis DSM 15929]